MRAAAFVPVVLAAALVGAALPVVPTGQAECYDDVAAIDCPDMPCDGDTAFCGQDAQYADHAQSPSELVVSDVDGHDVVEDALTGLTWRATFESDIAWDDAVSHCDALEHAGRDDWRLPTMHELTSLIDYGEYGPASRFPGMPSELFWSSNLDITGGTVGVGWIVGYSFGVVRRQTDPQGNLHARCVRGSSAELSDERMERDGDVVRDDATELIWQYGQGEHLTWSAALDYCEGLEHEGQDDWRLPQVHELRTLITLDRTNAASPFPELPSDYYWTSTTSVARSENAWCVHFPLGSVLYAHKSIGRLSSGIGMGAKCVRGGPPAQ